MEIWKDIPGYEGRYQVSNHGRVRSLIAGAPYIMRQQTHYRGYMRIFLYGVRGGGDRQHFVHVLVALAFLPNPNGLPVVNHKDLDKRHNHLVNLEWATYAENTQHYHANKIEMPESAIPF